MTNPIGINNLSQSSNIANATGDEVVSLDKHITSALMRSNTSIYSFNMDGAFSKNVFRR